ncbi:hydrolase 1, exosortase A system-associated [Parasphingopyxis marina]|uniref:Hydrolase 1, exosortase A system-associated n=1 Tax=Parasphingopyxis marina TaxID=2761622 RepID=A0A842I2A0_9SPHN|nr:hydrolase 1, exosortase A system-associated [Parasphingopyxis marina]MBC2777934.1 hydrolase 1, exosortase A system-associated [Parasphingopyxis marina]
MRALLSFDCAGECLAASLDGADGKSGVVIVTGGGQTRFGAHRGFALLASALSAAGYPVLRYDRRGVGDSSGDDPGFEVSAPDLAAAVAAFRERAPGLERVIGFGLCDGATTLCLHHAACGVDAMILANPWVVEAASGEPPPAAISRHYRDQLSSFDGWKRLLTGGIDYRKAVRGVFKLLKPQKNEGSLAERTANALSASSAPAHVVLASGDATAIGFEHEWRKGALSALAGEARFTLDTIESDAHSFAREGDFEKLAENCLAAIRRFENS